MVGLKRVQLSKHMIVGPTNVEEEQVPARPFCSMNKRVFHVHVSEWENRHLCLVATASSASNRTSPIDCLEGIHVGLGDLG